MKKLPTTLLAGLAVFALQAQEIVDVHSHILPPEYIAYLKQHNALMDEGFPLPKHNVEDRKSVV